MISGVLMGNKQAASNNRLAYQYGFEKAWEGILEAHTKTKFNHILRGGLEACLNSLKRGLSDSVVAEKTKTITTTTIITTKKHSVLKQKLPGPCCQHKL